MLIPQDGTTKSQLVSTNTNPIASALDMLRTCLAWIQLHVQVKDSSFLAFTAQLFLQRSFEVVITFGTICIVDHLKMEDTSEGPASASSAAFDLL